MANMQSKIKWISKLAYQGESRGHKIMMDAKKEIGGQDLGMTPKELVLAGLCGCSGMDVISLLTSKFKLNVKSLEISADATPTVGTHPVTWTAIRLEFNIKGEVDSEHALKAVELSLTRYCGVSAMLSKACPISYTVVLEDQVIGEGKAHFDA